MRANPFTRSIRATNPADPVTVARESTPPRYWWPAATSVEREVQPVIIVNHPPPEASATPPPPEKVWVPPVMGHAHGTRLLGSRYPEGMAMRRPPGRYEQDF